MNRELFEEIIASKGCKKCKIAAAANMTPKTFRIKLEGKSEFKTKEIVDISNFLHLTEDQVINIFLPCMFGGSKQ